MLCTAGEIRLDPGPAFYYSPDALVLADLSCRVVAMNAQVSRLTGWCPEEALGQPLCHLLGYETAHQALAGDSTPGRSCRLLPWRQNPAGIELPFYRRDGTVRTAELDAALLPAGDGQLFLLVVLRDVTDRCEERRLLEERAFTDALTGLGNRFRLKAVTQAIDRGGSVVPATVVVLDVDNMKAINDSCGHQAGDRVLRAIADLLQRHTRHTDLAVRYGGDEFVLLLPHTTLRQAQRLMRRLESLTASLQAFLELPLPVGLSYGLAQVAPGQHIEEALAVADRLMYRRKLLRRKRGSLPATLGLTPRGAAAPAPPRPENGPTDQPVQLRF